MIDGVKAGALILFTLFMLNTIANAEVKPSEIPLPTRNPKRVTGTLATAKTAPKAVEKSANAKALDNEDPCLIKLATGQNRMKAKLPLAGLKKLKAALEARSNQSSLKLKEIALLVDYTKSSKQKRGYIVDFKACDVLNQEYVAHGGAIYNPRYVNWGNPKSDGMLEYCLNDKGLRKNMTRPGLFLTVGCHKTRQKGWPIVQGGCHGVKLQGLEERNNDVFNAGVVLHEHVQIPNDGSIKLMGQGCPIFPPGHLKALINQYDFMKGMLVYLHAPQCADQKSAPTPSGRQKIKT